MIYRCCLVYPGNRRATQSVEATCPEEAANLVADSLHQEACIEIWNGSDRVLVKTIFAQQRRKSLEQFLSLDAPPQCCG